MSAAQKMSGCSHHDLALSAYLDGELDPCHAVDLEDHIRQCDVCMERVKLLRATRASLKRARAPRCPDALRARLGAVVAVERERAEDDEAHYAQPQLIRKRYAAALAVAAGVALAIGVARQKPEAAPQLASNALDEAKIAATVGSLLDDLIVQHAQPLPPETTNPEDLHRFDPFVGVPVRRPAFQPPFHVSFTGARVHTMRERRAALLQYTAAGGHRVTVYVFNSQALPVQKAPLLRPRVIRERPVYVGRINGYSVAAAERSGVGYALASDLGDEESTQLVLAAMQ